MGVFILGALALYLLISVGVVLWAISYAGNRNKSVWRWGVGAALVMYLIPFWDWLPTVAIHRYYCATEAGFWVYKTLDQWKQENPGVMDTLVANKGEPHTSYRDSDKHVDTYFLNSRLNMVVERQGPFSLHQWRYERKLIDTKSSGVLGRYVDFSTSQEKPTAGWSGWKFWLETKHCSDGRDNAVSSGEWITQFKGVEK